MATRIKRIGVVALLRGVNLGGHHCVKMESLRALYERLGFSDVSTYIQSGNVVFSAAPKQLDGAIARIERAFTEEFGFAAPTALRTTAEMREVIARSPFTGRGLDPAKMVVSFLSVAAQAQAVAGALAGYTGPEEVVALGRELYIHFPDGMGRSKLPIARIEKALGGTGTIRNWNTINKLLEMAERAEA
jgi:uncharacterized protein (DUF1697 family)